MAVPKICEFEVDPSNYGEFLLGEGQLLLTYNTRVLHGRTVFSPDSHRVLHGLWCDGRNADPDKIKFGFAPKNASINKMLGNKNDCALNVT